MSLARGGWTVNDPDFTNRLEGIAPAFGMKVVKGERRGEPYVLLEMDWKAGNHFVTSLDDRGWRSGLITSYLLERLQMYGISLHLKLSKTGDALVLFWKGDAYTIETEARHTLLEALVDVCEEVALREKGTVKP